MASIDTVESIAKLKAYPPSDKIIVYVKSYYDYDDFDPSMDYHLADGGGGMFRFDLKSNAIPDLGINFTSDHVERDAPGRWVRQYDGHINAAYFGIVKHPIQLAPTVKKNHERLQDAIDFCHRNAQGITYAGYSPSTDPFPDDLAYGDFTIYFPEGVYWLQPTESLILRSGTHLKGDTTTIIRLHEVLPSLDYLFKIDRGGIYRLCIETIKFNLSCHPSNDNRVGWLHAKGQPSDSGDFSGGLYGAIIKDVYVEEVGRHGIYFEGGEFVENDTSWNKTCNQFVYLENVWVERQFDYHNSFRITGQNVNMSFINCNPTMPNANFNDEHPTLLGAAFHVESVSQDTGFNQSLIFIGCDAGGAPGRPGEIGFYFKNARNVLIQNSWIEDSEFGIYVENCSAISILDNNFANAAANGGLNRSMLNPDRKGACIAVKNSVINVERNNVSIGYPDPEDIDGNYKYYNERFILGLTNEGTLEFNNTINSQNNYFANHMLSQTFGIAQYVEVKTIAVPFYHPQGDASPPCATKRGIITDGKKLVLLIKEKDVESPDNTIYRINSTLNAGETLHVFAEDADFTFVSMGIPEWTGKNIWLAFDEKFVLRQGHNATFVKFDGVNGNETCSYVLTSTY
ncbi:hypothetical protein [Flavobacterium pallidum]|uniref:Right handed beta helix domain-containing protein n=1 Tax=Flavobacterium pallidum TaxID=2172098 RepID=A0A2S1SHS3_9FLAO|nr:hypothetical protein [Flavobacterium pallidum]AWI25950.1 hypothetical protein HYN49_08580 [Flavobacterium pallidum]